MATSLFARAMVRAYDSSTYEAMVARDMSSVTTLSQNVLRQFKHRVSSSVTEQIALGDIDSAIGLFVTSDVPVTIYCNGSAAAAAFALSAAAMFFVTGAQIGSLYVANPNAASVANLDVIAWK